jgi:NAD(P)-dependent dehydrogenase (short-subunit alcohol dehydrogenase family)
MSIPIQRRVVAITGAARGIGFTTARTLKDRGARVAIADIDEARLKEAALELDITTYARLDVTDSGSFRAFLTKVENELGPLQVLVNNAGIMPAGPLLQEPERLTRRIIEINVLGVIIGTKLALESMTPRHAGHIINVASMAAEAHVPGLATYCGSKAAVLAFTEAARQEFRTSGVRLSTVLPSFVNTELTSGTRSVPGIRNAEPEEIANAIADLLERPQPRAYVTRLAGLLVKAERLIPHQITEPFNRLLGSETTFLGGLDQERRRAYEERVRNT